MSLHWYACIPINTDFYMMYNISSGNVWWVLSNASLIMEIHLVIPEIIANKTYNYWWSEISVICCHFCTSYIYTNSPYLRLSSATYFVKISLLVVKIQVE